MQCTIENVRKTNPGPFSFQGPFSFSKSCGEAVAATVGYTPEEGITVHRFFGKQGEARSSSASAAVGYVALRKTITHTAGTK